MKTQYSFLQESKIDGKINPKDIDYNEVDRLNTQENTDPQLGGEKYDDPNNPVKNNNFFQPYTHKDNKKPHYYPVSDNVIENLAHVITFCKDGQSIFEKQPEAIQESRIWYKCFSTPFYRYQNEADKVKRNYNNISINDVKTLIQLFKTIPYIYFISGSIDLVIEYSKQLNIEKSYTYNENDPNDQELMQYDKLYLNSLTEYYNCYINNLKQLKLDFQH